jgi:hypothetical protein
LLTDPGPKALLKTYNTVRVALKIRVDKIRDAEEGDCMGEKECVRAIEQLPTPPPTPPPGISLTIAFFTIPHRPEHPVTVGCVEESSLKLTH